MDDTHVDYFECYDPERGGWSFVIPNFTGVSEKLACQVFDDICFDPRENPFDIDLEKMELEEYENECKRFEEKYDVPRNIRSLFTRFQILCKTIDTDKLFKISNKKIPPSVFITTDEDELFLPLPCTDPTAIQRVAGKIVPYVVLKICLKNGHSLYRVYINCLMMPVNTDSGPMLTTNSFENVVDYLDRTIKKKRRKKK